MAPTANKNNTHWVLNVVNVNLDSRSYVCQEIDSIKTGRQKDGFSCGIHVMETIAESIHEGSENVLKKYDQPTIGKCIYLYANIAARVALLKKVKETIKSEYLTLMVLNNFDKERAVKDLGKLYDLKELKKISGFEEIFAPTEKPVLVLKTRQSPKKQRDKEEDSKTEQEKDSKIVGSNTARYVQRTEQHFRGFHK